jgi:hypothetical protein
MLTISAYIVMVTEKIIVYRQVNMSFHRFSASSPLALKLAPRQNDAFGVAASILCPVATSAGGLTVDYNRAASAKAQLQSMLAAVARNDGVISDLTTAAPEQTATSPVPPPSGRKAH